jgi:chromosome segregation protein
MEALARSVEEGKVRLSGLQGEIDRIQREVEALGAVNLAALDELTQSRERKHFLDAQNADLREAIGTLEDAIHRIDHETRDLLQKTFDEVNTHFGRMFPSLFGGGSARLVMTGGEQALTALSLIFAVFLTNPAPICVLDEVDAPLDDANVERFCNLLDEMNRTTETRFVVITHNPITMSRMNRLFGVTMAESGVSQLVSVDLETAERFLEAV